MVVVAAAVAAAVMGYGGGQRQSNEPSGDSSQEGRRGMLCICVSRDNKSKGGLGAKKERKRRLLEMQLT